MAAKKTTKKPPLGSGKRFAKLEKQLDKQGVKDPGALAASIGRKKYGKAKYDEIAEKGQNKSAKKDK